MFAAVRDIVGGRSAAYERELGKAREVALEDLEDWAEELGTNAVVGVAIDYESFGQSNGMMMVSVTSTAVVVVDSWSPLIWIKPRLTMRLTPPLCFVHNDTDKTATQKTTQCSD